MDISTNMKEEVYPGEMINKYDLLLAEAYPEHYKLRIEVAELLQGHLEKIEKAKIIDIGCGKGETLEYILKLLTNVEVVAIDIDEKMISGLEEHLREYIQNGQLTPVRQDIFEYIKGVESESLDGITSSWTIHNFTKSERKKLLEEIFRTLKPGGIFVNMDKYVFDDPQKEKESLAAAIENLKAVPDKEISEIAIQHEEDDRHPDIIMKEQESAREMEQIGFRDIKFHSRVGRETVMACEK